MTFPYPVLHVPVYDPETGEWHCPDCTYRGGIDGVIDWGDPSAHHEGAAGAPGACEPACMRIKRYVELAGRLGEMSGEVER